VAGQALEKPASHFEASFVSDHRILANEKCADCHGPIEYGTDNSGFCANGACHAQEWTGTVLAAAFVHPAELEGNHEQVLCSACHQGELELSLDDCASCHLPPGEPHFGSECAACHTPQGWEASASAWLVGIPSAPHGVEAAMNCLECHGDPGPKPVPASHVGMSAASCASCHEGLPAEVLVSIPHVVGEADSCQACHSDEPLKPASALHQGIPADSCLGCHKGGDVVQAPTVPHIVEGRGFCLTCHGEEELAPAPRSHRGWTNEFCQLCHRAS
jgi:hypothetical protein